MENRIKARRSDDADAFIPESAPANGAGDDLAQLLAENHQLSVITNEDEEEEARDAPRTEEMGGPFVETSSAEEFGPTMSGAGTEPEGEAASLPEAVGPLAIASAEEETEDLETLAERSADVDPPDAQGEPPSHLEPDIAAVARMGRPADRPRGR